MHSPLLRFQMMIVTYYPNLKSTRNPFSKRQLVIDKPLLDNKKISCNQHLCKHNLFQSAAVHCHFDQIQFQEV